MSRSNSSSRTASRPRSPPKYEPQIEELLDALSDAYGMIRHHKNCSWVKGESDNCDCGASAAARQARALLIKHRNRTWRES